MAVETFQTDRLTAERVGAQHFDDLCRMHGDARVMATLGGVRDDAKTRAFLDASLEHWTRHGFGLWIIRDRSTDDFAGRAGLLHVEVEGAPEIELAYAFLPPYWGRGLATETGAALLDVGFRSLGLEEVVCFTQTTNRASRRVMEKLGFRHERSFVRAALPHALYRLKRTGSAQAPLRSDDARFMQVAIGKAREGIVHGQSPFGACIARGAEIVSSEHNVVWQTTDITAHAEVHAIRSAGAKLGTIDLSGCTIYSTCEPCPMCFGACHWAHLDRIVFGATIADAAAIGFKELSIPNDTMKKLGGSPIEIAGGFMAAECRALFEEWMRRGGRRTY